MCQLVFSSTESAVEEIQEWFEITHQELLKQLFYGYLIQGKLETHAYPVLVEFVESVNVSEKPMQVTVALMTGLYHQSIQDTDMAQEWLERCLDSVKGTSDTSIEYAALLHLFILAVIKGTQEDMSKVPIFIFEPLYR